MGLSWIRLATSKSTVWSSENVRMLSPMAALSDLLTDLMRDSDVPFCHGASAGVKFHYKTFHNSKTFKLLPIPRFRNILIKFLTCCDKLRAVFGIDLWWISSKWDKSAQHHKKTFCAVVWRKVQIYSSGSNAIKDHPLRFWRSTLLNCFTDREGSK